MNLLKAFCAFMIAVSVVYAAPTHAQTIRTVVPEGAWSYDNIVPEVNTIHNYFLNQPGLGSYEERVRERNKRVRRLFASALQIHRAALAQHRIAGELTLTVTSNSGYKSRSGWLDFGSNYDLFEPSFSGNGLKGQLIVEPHRVGFSVGGQRVRGTVTANGKYTETHVTALAEAERAQARAKCRAQNLPDDTTPNP